MSSLAARHPARRSTGGGRLARDVGLFGELGPRGLPRRDGEPELLAEFLHFPGGGLAGVVGVAELEPVAPVDLVLRRARRPEDVHRADVPLLERRLGLGVGRRVPGELLDPVLAVADVELLLLEDAVDGAHPGAVGAAADVLELVPRTGVHAEVEEDEVGPGVDRVVENIDALVGRDPPRPDVGVGGDPHGEDLVVLPDVRLDVEPEVGEEPVHDRRVAELVLHDLGDDVLLLDGRRLRDPGHVAVAARELGVGLHGHQVDEVLAVLGGHLLGGLEPDAALDLRQHLPRRVAHGVKPPGPSIPYSRRSTTRTALPSERGRVRGATIVSRTESPIARCRRSAARARTATISGCSASKPPQRATTAGAGSTSTSSVASVALRSTISRYSGARSATSRRARSTSDGYRFTPFTTSMSSERPLTRAIRTDVRPQRQGSSTSVVMSPVR